VTQTRNLNQAKYVPELAYHGLYLLCSSIHGEGDKVIGCVFHQMLNVILMLEAGEGAHRAPLSITTSVINSRNQAVQFISSLVDELKENIFPVLRILLQHICAKVPFALIVIMMMMMIKIYDICEGECVCLYVYLFLGMSLLSLWKVVLFNIFTTCSH